MINKANAQPLKTVAFDPKWIACHADGWVTATRWARLGDDFHFRLGSILYNSHNQQRCVARISRSQFACVDQVFAARDTAMEKTFEGETALADAKKWCTETITALLLDTEHYDPKSNLSETMTATEIETEFGLSTGTVRQYLKNHGDEMRERGVARKSSATWLIQRAEAERIWGRHKQDS